MILVHDLGMQKVCAKMVPKILSEDQKQNGVKFCEDMLEKIKDDPNILRQIITGMKLGFSSMILKQRGKACSGRLQNHPDPRRCACQNQKIKVMLIAFFDQKGMVHHEIMPEGETINQHFYQPVLICLHN